MANLGDEFVEAMSEALAHAQGNDVGARETQVTVPALAVQRVRTKLGVSRERFALLLGVSVVQLQSWEAGGDEPTGAAATLLQIMDAEPERVAKILALNHEASNDHVAAKR